MPLYNTPSAVDGSGTSGNLSKFTASRTVGDSLLAESGANILFSGTMFQIGGATASFPGFIRSGALVQFRLADNSARAGVEASTLGLTSHLTISDAANMAFGTTTGTRMGTSTSQKIGFWNSTPVIQQSSTGTTTGFTAGISTPVLADSTFTGGTGSTAYTLGDIVKHLKTIGLIAS